MHDSICEVVIFMTLPEDSWYTQDHRSACVRIRKDRPPRMRMYLVIKYDLYGSPVQAGEPIFVL